MLKKWFHIFTLFCLINSNPLMPTIGPHGDHDSLLNILIGQFQDDDDDDSSETPLKTFGRHAWSVVRGFNVNVRTPLLTVFQIFRLQGITRHVYGNHLIRKPTLPYYYNFLFRLSPF